MAFFPNYRSKLTHFDLARYELKIDEIQCDPYELKWDDLSEDMQDWPRVTAMDRIDYLVTRTNFATKDAMRNMKSMEAHNFVTSGLVFLPRVKTLPEDRMVLLGKVSVDTCCVCCL